VDINVTQDVKDFLTTPSLNLGWKISQDKVRALADNNTNNRYTANIGLFGFKSSENTDVAHRPELVMLDNTVYTPNTIGACTRTFGTMDYTWGASSTSPVPLLPVNLNVQRLGAMTSVTIVENLPTTPVFVSAISAGGRQVGNQIIWEVGFASDVTVTYTMIALWNPNYNSATGSYPPLFFEGGSVTDSAGGQTVPFQNASIKHSNTYVYQKGVYEGLMPNAAYAGVQDATIMSDQPLNNAGALRRIEEGSTTSSLNDHRTMLLRFDMSGAPPPVPMVTTMTKATIRLYATGERLGNKHNAHGLLAWSVLKQWNEGAGNVEWDGRTSQTGEVTWGFSMTAGIQWWMFVPWQMPGAMGTSDVRTSEPSLSWNAQYPKWIELDVTKTTRDMATTPSLNLGWKIGQDRVRGVAYNTPGNEFVNGLYQFVSSNATDVLPIYRPMLVIRPITAVPVELSRFMLY